MNLLKWFKKLFNFIPEDKGFIDEVDSRSFGAEVIGGAVTKDDIPTEDFIVYDPKLKDQLDTDFCVNHSLAYAREATEKVQLSASFNFAWIKRFIDGSMSWGTSPLKACKSAVKIGIPELKYYNYNKRGKRNWFANWSNVPKEAKNNAELHKAQSYFELKSRGMDRFDTILAYMNKFKKNKLLVLSGVDKHAVTGIGRATRNEVVTIQCKDSYDRAGMRYRVGKYEKGYRYFTRAEANQLFTPYMITDIPRALAEVLNEYNGKAIKTEDDKNVYLVKDGKKKLFRTEYYGWSHNIKLWSEINIISKQDIELIPLGEPVKIDEGEYWEVMKEIAVKEKIDWAKKWL